MNKLQLKIVRFAVLLESKSSMISVVFYFLVVSVIAMLFKIELSIYLLVAFLPISMVVFTVAIFCRGIYTWARRVFFRNFGFWPIPSEEIDVLKKLRDEALKLQDAFHRVDRIYRAASETRDSKEEECLNNQADKIKYSAYGRFWSMWRLAKALGFPVFRSWRTHLKIKFQSVNKGGG